MNLYKYFKIMSLFLVAFMAPGVAMAQGAAFDSGDTAWMLVSALLVLMMTVPGLALFYGGLVKRDNVLSTLTQSLAIAALVSVVWPVIGYSLAFTPGSVETGTLIGGLDKLFLEGVTTDSAVGTIPETVFIVFQLTFAIITAALLVGAVADRIKFTSLLIFVPVWIVAVYAPIAHWVWGPGGFIGGVDMEGYHGFLGMGDNWKTLGRQFSELGYQVHLVDQRNHGRSFHSTDFDYDLLSADLKVYIQQHQLERVVILGHSMGGKTAMTYATQYPEMVDKLIVADISPRYYPIHHDAILEGLSQLDFNEIKTRSAADQALSAFVPEMGIRQFLLKNLYWVEKGKLGLRINLPILKQEVAEVGEALEPFAKYMGPTLFLRGDRSEYIQPSDEHLIHQHFPEAKVITVEKAGHWLHAENPKAFYSEVADFIKN